jgi:hypothetical protein
MPVQMHRRIKRGKDHLVDLLSPNLLSTASNELAESFSPVFPPKTKSEGRFLVFGVLVVLTINLFSSTKIHLLILATTYIIDHTIMSYK